MFVVSQAVGGIEENLELLFDIIGSTGNLYKVTIKKEPECDCPDGRKGNFCKHIIYSESQPQNPSCLFGLGEF